ncbi:zinc finger protein 62 isoform X2 [Manduca sexta]|uniref:zinc finger protein 62 isoform X2 n=1 Tax=Manduca sexta TaxID=7130 RepID=UPI0011844DDB|nr:zinc finger protein 62 isoform X2 [Manduca sexta]
MEFDEIVVKESPGLCRCCLSEGCYKDLGSEYTWMNDNEIYADMLLECFDISITQHNDGPNGPNRLICEVCITRLRDACNFKKQVQESEKKFIDMVARGDFRPKVLMYQAQMKSEENVEEVIVEEIEYLDDETDFGDDEPLKPEDPSVSDITVEPLPVKGKRGRPRKNADIKTEKRIKVAKTEEKAKTSKAVAKDEYPPGPYEGCTSERRRKNLRIIFNHTTVMPFKWRGKYLCFYCGKSYTEYDEFKKHTKSHGDCNTKDYALRMIKGSHIEIKIDVSEIVCDICNEPFDRFDEIVDHLICKHKLEYDKNVDIPYQEYRLADFRCLHCEQQFSYFGYLVNHVNNAHPQNSFICDDCGVSFNKKRDLAVHFRNYHRQGGYPCDQCLLNFETFHTLRRHQNNIHYRQCNSCGLRFASLSLLQKHINIDHPDDGSYKCNYCSKELHSAQGLNQHKSKCKVKLITHVEPGNSVTPVDSIEARKNLNLKQMRQNIQCILNMSTAIPFKFFSKYTCFYCSSKYVEFEELRDHTALEHPVCDLKSKYMSKCKGERVSVKIDISVLACKLCCLPMLGLTELTDHLISEHKANYDKSITGCLEPFRIVKDNIPCPLCTMAFRYFSTLQRHMNAVHSNNNRICDFCGKSFRNVTNLKVHISYTHTGTCECHICGAKYKNQWCLARHKAKHHDVKDYKCTKCAEQFHSQYQRQKHLIKVHDEGHKCTYCGRMFTRNSFMKDHIRRTHLKEKNVPCSVCNEKFFDNYLLRMHMVKHEGERKFTCEVCGKAFLRRSNLSSHKEMHKKYGHV